MEQNQEKKCLICLQEMQNAVMVQGCKHNFCIKCIKGYIDTLKKYNLLTPQKLTCLHDNCQSQLSDSLIQSLYPGQQGFILSVVRQRYKQSKDPSMRIFNCKGYTKPNRKPLIDKPVSMARQIHSKMMNQKMRNILSCGVKQQQQMTMCTNILSFNKLNVKEKIVQCYICGVSYCTGCEDFVHDGRKCQYDSNGSKQLSKYIKKGLQSQNSTDIEAYLKANQMTKCLNPKCGLAIAKEEGCFWVKCRCSWEFCYPCQKLWGDCQHFSKYPYKKFVPPPEWMVKALNLY